MKPIIKGLIIGFVLGIIYTSSASLNATNEEDWGVRGAVEWKPLYVKIVK